MSVIPLFIPYQICLPLVQLGFLLFSDYSIFLLSYFFPFLQLFLCQDLLLPSLLLFRLLLVCVLGIFTFRLFLQSFLFLPFLLLSLFLLLFRFLLTACSISQLWRFSPDIVVNDLNDNLMVGVKRGKTFSSSALDRVLLEQSPPVFPSPFEQPDSRLFHIK